MYLQMTHAAKTLHMSRAWLYQLINRGDLGTSEIGGRRFVLEDERFRAIQRERAKLNGKRKAA